MTWKKLLNIVLWSISYKVTVMVDETVEWLLNICPEI